MRPIVRVTVTCLLVVSLAVGYGVDPAIGLEGGQAPVDGPNAVEREAGSPSVETTSEGVEPACPAGARSSVASDVFSGSNRSAEDERHHTRRATAAEKTDGDPVIVEVFPDTPRPNNAGEYLAVALPEDTSFGNLTVSDGHASARLPNVTRSGVVALSARPNETASFTDAPVVAFDGGLRLAADGDELTLREDGRRVDAVQYERATENHVWYRTNGSVDQNTRTHASGSWWPREATCLPVASAEPDSTTAFALPDSPEVALDAIRDADERILLGGYTFTDRTVADGLVAAVERGVQVEILVEASPVGGTPESTSTVLDDLAAAGATVRVIGGEDDRYAFHHPKYAVTDDEAVVTTENWKPAGVGGAGSRGLGVRVNDVNLADALATVFRADTNASDVRPWTAYRQNATFAEDDENRPAWAAEDSSEEDAEREEYPSAIGPSEVDADAVELLLAPDNAEGRLLELLRSAEESVRVTQPTIDDADLSLLSELVAAARRGVDVRILLDRSWYVADENERLADRLEELANDEDLSLSVRLVDSGDRFEKIHAKGIVVDGETSVVGSVNWNENSLRNNREVALVLHGEAVGAYYATVFDRDWEGYGGAPGPYSLPIGLAAVVVVALLVAGLAGSRYVDFERTASGSGRRFDTTVQNDSGEPDASGFERKAGVGVRSTTGERDGIVIRPPDGETGSDAASHNRVAPAERNRDGPR